MVHSTVGDLARVGAMRAWFSPTVPELLILCTLVLPLLLLVYALVDAIKNPGLTDNERLIWVIVIIFVGCLGPILYLAIGRNKGPRGPAGGPTI